MVGTGRIQTLLTCAKAAPYLTRRGYIQLGMRLTHYTFFQVFCFAACFPATVFHEGQVSKNVVNEAVPQHAHTKIVLILRL